MNMLPALARAFGVEPATLERLVEAYEDPLKPCPFCGEPVKLYEVGPDHGGDGGYWAIECTKPRADHFCGVHGEDKDEVIAAWNRRAALHPEAQQQEGA